MDLQIGRVLQALDANGLAENTIVIFTSDNGGERFADTWPFTGRKTELLEGGLRIPAMIRGRRGFRRAAPREQVAISMDWLPTLLAAAGTAPDPAYPPDGINLLPMLTQNAALRLRASCSGATRPTRSGPMRDGDYKYPQDPRQHISVQRRRRPDGARQPERAPEGRL